MELVLCATKYRSEPNGYRDMVESGGRGFGRVVYGIA